MQIIGETWPEFGRQSPKFARARTSFGRTRRRNWPTGAKRGGWDARGSVAKIRGFVGHAMAGAQPSAQSFISRGPARLDERIGGIDPCVAGRMRCGSGVFHRLCCPSREVPGEVDGPAPDAPRSSSRCPAAGGSCCAGAGSADPRVRSTETCGRRFRLPQGSCVLRGRGMRRSRQQSRPSSVVLPFPPPAALDDHSARTLAECEVDLWAPSAVPSPPTPPPHYADRRR